MDYSPVDPSDMDSGSSSSYQVASPSDNESMAPRHNINKGHGGPNRGPYLALVEQPQMNFRFRYKSEMGGTHGCLLGETTKTKHKTHPGVELLNYTGRARIKCRLVQCDRDEDHPHTLQTDDEPGVPQDISGEVGPQGYKLFFPEMGIIYTAKKNVPGEIYKRELSMRPEMFVDEKSQKRLMQWSMDKAKDINLNIVRLKFSAHHWDTDELICPPVFSTAIHNLKSAETNELRICRMDRGAGSVRGNDEVYILVEKVNKKNIRVRLVEVNEFGDTVWSEDALFTQADVHHQFAIVFKTPPYINQLTSHDVNVFVELFRPQDGRTSQRMAFTYKADPRYVQRKKRKANPSHSSFSSMEDSSGGSLNSDLPLILDNLALKTDDKWKTDEPRISISVPQSVADPAAPAAMTQYMKNLVPQSASTVTLSDALYLREHQAVPTMAPPLIAPGGPVPPQATFTGVFISSLDFNSAGEFNQSDTLEKALRGVANSADFKNCVENFSSDPFTEYRNYLEDSRLNDDHEATFIPGITTDFNKYQGLKTDTGEEAPKGTRAKFQGTENVMVKKEPYSASYTKEDGKEVHSESTPDQSTSSDIIDVRMSEVMNSLVADFCKIAKSDAKNRNKVLTCILKNLMTLRLSNGDTFLHMLIGQHSSLEMMVYIVRQMRELDLPELLNLQNHQGETLLHLVVQRQELSPHVALLLQSGCDPMLDDLEGNNALHTAVLHSEKNQASCLKELLKVMEAHPQNHYNLNAMNNCKETPLVLAAKYGNTECVNLLLRAGASVGLDPSGRHPLHIAASGDHLGVIQTLFQFIDKSEVDCVDQNGNTALQIVCSGSPREHTLGIMGLLLQNGADILKKSGGNSCPLKLAATEPRMLALLREYARDDVVEIKSEPEDDPESADEDSSDEDGCDQSAPYMHEVAAILDHSGKWRELADKLDCNHIMNYIENTMSPTSTIFNQHFECEKQLNPKILAQFLEEIGEKEASQVVLRHMKKFQ